LAFDAARALVPKILLAVSPNRRINVTTATSGKEKRMTRDAIESTATTESEACEAEGQAKSVEDEAREEGTTDQEAGQ